MPSNHLGRHRMWHVVHNFNLFTIIESDELLIHVIVLFIALRHFGAHHIALKPLLGSLQLQHLLTQRSILLLCLLSCIFPALFLFAKSLVIFLQLKYHLVLLSHCIISDNQLLSDAFILLDCHSHMISLHCHLPKCLSEPLTLDGQVLVLLP